MSFFFFFNDTATTEIYTLSLHDALPIWLRRGELIALQWADVDLDAGVLRIRRSRVLVDDQVHEVTPKDRKSTRLNSSHANISYAVFCLKKKKNKITHRHTNIHNHSTAQT